MNVLNLVQVPANPEQDINPGSSVWVNGKIAYLNLGTSAIIYMDHEYSTEDVTDEETGEVIDQVTVCRAWEIEVPMPLRRATILNQAEKIAYGLTTDSEQISYVAALDRKARKDPEDPEVIEHDQLIEHVKEQLNEYGILV